VISPADLRRYLALARRWLWLVLLAALAAAAGAYLLTPRLPPFYVASATLLYQSSLSRMGDLADQQVAQSLAQIGQVILRSGGAELAGSDAPASTARGVSVRWLPNTQLIELTAVDFSPGRAAARANAAAASLVAWQRERNQARYGEQVTALQGQMDELSAEMAALQAQIAARPAPATSEEKAEKARLEAALATARGIYVNRLALYAWMSANATQSGASLTVIVEAAPPQDSRDTFSARATRRMLLAGLAAAALAIGVALLFEYLNDTIETADDVKSALGLSTLGTLGTLVTAGGELIAATQSNVPATEQCRVLRTNIRYFDVERPLRTLLVTSASPGEGKSTIAANLAVVMAQAGQRVVLLDGDLRRPRLHRLFAVPLQGGLATSLLAGRLDGNIQAAPAVARLSVLPAGPLPPNPAELLGSQAMRKLLDDLAQQADMVLMDSPPVLAVTDAALLAQIVDGVLLIVEAGKTRRGMAREAIARLRQVRGNLIGVVLNRAPAHGGDGSYYYGDGEGEQKRNAQNAK
jgi:non-specific protein-tyrosine kinase